MGKKIKIGVLDIGRRIQPAGHHRRLRIPACPGKSCFCRVGQPGGKGPGQGKTTWDSLVYGRLRCHCTTGQIRPIPCASIPAGPGYGPCLFYHDGHGPIHRIPKVSQHFYEPEYMRRPCFSIIWPRTPLICWCWRVLCGH